MDFAARSRLVIYRVDPFVRLARRLARARTSDGSQREPKTIRERGREQA